MPGNPLGLTFRCAIFRLPDTIVFKTDAQDTTLCNFQILRTHVLFAKTSGHNSPVMSGPEKTITSGVRQAGSIYDNVAHDDASVGIVRTLAEPKSLHWNRSHDAETA